jgi:hypothetical protein
MTEDKPSMEWSPEAVRRQLKKTAAERAEGSVNAQVFFDESVSADYLPKAAERAITEAAARVGRSACVKVSRVHKLANSVSVIGDPDVIAELVTVSPVKTVLPSEIEDIYPKPTRTERQK